MRLVTKLLVSFITVAVLVLITGSFSYYLSETIKNDLIVESNETTTELQRITDMTVTLQNSLLYLRNYVTERGKVRAGDESLTTASQLRTSEENVLRNLEEFELHLNVAMVDSRNHNFSSVELSDVHLSMHQLLDSLQSAFDPYQTLTLELIELEREAAYGEEVFNVTIEPYFRNTLLPLLQNLRGNSAAFVALQQVELEERAERTANIIITITILAFALSLFLAFITYSSIAKPLKEISTVTREVGRGNLDKRIAISSNDELGYLADSFNTMAENLSKSMVSRSYVNNIVQSMGDMLMVADSKGDVKLSNKMVYEKLGYSERKLEDFKIWELFNEADRENIFNLFHDSDRDISTNETIIVTYDQDEIPVIFSFNKVEDELKDENNWVFVFSDVSKLKEAEQKITASLHEKNILLAEIHHRVKNNLAVISGLLQMQMWNIENENAREALLQSQLRIQSIALVHEKLYKNDTFAEILISEFIEELVETVAASTSNPDKNIQIVYDLEPVKMNINQAIPFSLLVNECIVNAYKHAFPERKDGEIRVMLVRNGSSIEVEITDDGIGLPDHFDIQSESSLGVTLIRTLVNQLKGEADYIRDKETTGTRFAMRFKLDEED
ncbi:MAG: sensor histidine kinase [Balneolaceae bacterium]